MRLDIIFRWHAIQLTVGFQFFIVNTQISCNFITFDNIPSSLKIIFNATFCTLYNDFLRARNKVVNNIIQIDFSLSPVLIESAFPYFATIISSLVKRIRRNNILNII